MRVLVIGAAGRTGRHVVELALGHGHEVRAMVRSTELAMTHPRLEVVRGDVTREHDVESAAEGCEGVVFAVGGGGGRDVCVYSAGIGNVLYAMALHRVGRLVAISAAGAFARTDRRLSLPFRALIATTLKSTYDDMERMEQLIAASGVEWTIVRPYGLTDDAATGAYRLTRDGSLLPKASRVPRADVAGLALKALETGAFDGQTLTAAL